MLKINLKDILKIRIMIGEKGYSLRKFSEEIEISQSYLSQILSKKRNPSPYVANKIAKGLDVKLTDIFFTQIDNKCNHEEVN